MRNRSLAAGVIVFAFASAGFAASYEDAFKKGIIAYDRRQWSDVVAAMTAAIAANGTESSQKVFIYGTRYVPYTPHFYLGMALAKLSRCNEALPELQSSEQQGAIVRLAEYRDLKQVLSACAPPGQQHATASAAPEKTKPAAGGPATEKLQPSDPLAPRVAPPQDNRPPAVVNDTVGSVAKPKRDDVEPSAAKQALERISTDARKLLKSSKASSRAAGARAALASAIDKASHVRTSVSASRQNLQTALNTSPEASSQRVAIDPQLADAVRAYLRGDYQRVNSVLASLDKVAANGRGQAALFRAAARYSLYLIGGERDDGLKQSAVADVREYKRRDPSRSPDPRVFAPSFRQLCEQVAR
ncbi:MAG TPA: hypothetical protein VF962_10405 [Gemmatimonadaceae bacterium]